MTTLESTHPVLIIGGGPSGLLLAFILSQFGVPSLLVERYNTRLAAPKAHALSPRSLELCRQVGLDVNEMRAQGTSRADAYWVNFITSLGGRLVGRLPYERMDREVLDATSMMIHNIPQPDFEELVAKRVRKSPLVGIRKNHSFVKLEDRGSYVVTTIEDRNTQQEYQVRSSHVVACDGAKSAVRRYLGVESEGEDSYETMMTIHINADLRPVLKDRVGMLHWVMDPEAAGFIIGYDLSVNQVLICNFDSDKYPVSAWNEAHCRKVVDKAIGANVPYEVLSYRPWILSRKVAKSYRVGNVFLAGDAAHSFPPTGGLGLNSGIGDVHNLAYKLAAVHGGWGGDRLLDSYEADRRQVALVNSLQSVKNGKQIFGLLKTIGTTDPDTDAARRNLFRNIDDHAKMQDISQGIEEQREHFDNLGLHVGYVYGDDKIPPHASTYTPVCIPGARLPHAWIQVLAPEKVPLPAIDCSYVTDLSPAEVRAKQFSTLDLCAFDAFTLFVDARSAALWEHRLRDVRQRLPPSVAASLKLRIAVCGVDFELHPGHNSTAWLQLMKLSDGQGTLVRPDQHILMCFDSQSRPEEVLDALQGHLDLDLAG
ncbi:hypothetical protein ASPZODRAFT_158388 [Penicilliopsis zonata CBS 506.65]|uniref:FAD-binding domain-containing protein n=1 Tax=Penicilliopsis zonata CBS 506.65 TaxID=1073090 RepID=A0A1L9SNP4_9EURO|nr:hypothetical protein ASPZODRAFT_158388 [Penicilliopsis zonata CBS 506.65]OJJ48746.1 hypothetical protein ASPZODRAFT_158388 [Penicilliopsis zonata CBS 506.65]